MIFIVTSAITVFNMKLYKLFFFWTNETVDVNTIECATFDVEKTQN